MTREQIEENRIVAEHYGSFDDIISSINKEGTIRSYFPKQMEKLDIIVSFLRCIKNSDEELKKAIEEANRLYPNSEAVELAEIEGNRIVNIRSESPINLEAVNDFIEEMREEMKSKRQQEKDNE